MNITPDQLFPNMTVTANDITIPLSDLQGLTASEANPTTGDGRELARILTDKIVTTVTGLPIGDRPTRMVVSKATPSGIGIEQIRQSYSLSFDLSYDGLSSGMVAEPVA